MTNETQVEVLKTSLEIGQIGDKLLGLLQSTTFNEKERTELTSAITHLIQAQNNIRKSISQ